MNIFSNNTNSYLSYFCKSPRFVFRNKYRIIRNIIRLASCIACIINFCKNSNYQTIIELVIAEATMVQPHQWAYVDDCKEKYLTQ